MSADSAWNDILKRLSDDYIARAMETGADSVRVFVSHPNGSTTACHTRGGGNYYAQRGSVDAWVRRENEKDRVEARPKCEDGETA